MTVTLDSLCENEKALIISIKLHGRLRSRLNDLGFVGGTPVECVKKNKTISAYQIRGAVIALRSDTSSEILTEKI
ncbi:MAG: ferrous iron transport protein A [Ruminococcus sp.]|nr:ferrous iron transport protein A [Ruminococcus sp.]